MIKLRRLILPLAFILSVLVSCTRSERIGRSEDPRLQKSFSGNYKVCERITLGFGKNGKFACQFNSTEFVGHFNDIVWGTYFTDDTHIYLHVDRLNDDNIVYKSLPLELADSVVFSPSGGLTIYFDDQTSALSPGNHIGSFSTEGNKEDMITIYLIIGIGYLFVYGTPVVLSVALIWLIVSVVKNRRRSKPTC